MEATTLPFEGEFLGGYYTPFGLQIMLKTGEDEEAGTFSADIKLVTFTDNDYIRCSTFLYEQGILREHQPGDTVEYPEDIRYEEDNQ